MGTLPWSLLNRRGGLPSGTPGVEYRPGQMLPPDMMQQDAYADLNSAPQYSPDYQEAVTSVHNVRPINAIDFYFRQQAVFDIYAEARTAVDFVYLVPIGYVGMLKQVRWVWDNPLISVANTDSSFPPYVIPTNANAANILQILSQDIVQEGYANLAQSAPIDKTNENETFPAELTTPMPLSGSVETYVLADEQTDITFRVRPAQFQGINGFPQINTVITVQMYGTLLLKSGLPINIEPGSL
jgi:hypothetical protein